MAPSRRKGAKKSTAIVVYRRWNVGDLVLAKVKGFPAWPAMVSEPEKWGYSADQKKVFVQFFGTQQIAFCSPADVEAFTEENKKSLVKRLGRGADFVRAVKEILECYEKTKGEVQVDETSSGGEVANTIPIDPSANSGLKNQVDAPWTINSQIKSSNSGTDRSELFGAAMDDSAVAWRDESYNNEATGGAVETATVKSPFLGTQGNEPRSRSSSLVQNFVVPCSGGGNNGGNNDGNMSADAIQKTSVRRIKHIRKSPHIFGRGDTDSSAFASNVSLEENGSGIITINSDACSLNEGSTIDSNLKLEQSVEYPEYEVGLNKALDHEMKAVIDKKKRKSKLMRETNNAGAQNPSQSLQNTCESSKERWHDHNGDEHLPLLKRARVRMCKSPSTEAEHSGIAQVQEKSFKVDITDSPKQIITSSNCENGSLVDGDSSALNGAFVNVSPNLLAPCSENGSQVCKVKEDKIVGCSIDDESALPPSKRLHRALEAMSANAAEEEACIASSSSIMASSGRCCMSTMKRCSSMTIVNQGEDKSSMEVDKQLTRFQQHESAEGVISGARHEVGEDLSDPVACQPPEIDSEVPVHGKLSPNLDVQCCQVGSNQDSTGPSLEVGGNQASAGPPLPPSDEDNIRPLNHSNAPYKLDYSGTSLDPVAGPSETGKLLPQNSINMPSNVMVVREDMKQTAGDNSRINQMHEVVEEVKFKGRQEDMNSASISNDCSGGKGTLGILGSPSLAGGGFCLPHGSPPNTSVCNVSTSDSSNILQNGSCSPDVLQKNTFPGPTGGWKDGAVANQQSRSTGKSTEARQAALLYFEAMLGTLTRTKESISRATRIAIDCAKYGSATKVVEILVRNLETEPSLHRRVDLFFLVDSIAQSSRGLKGDVAGVYPSAMQAVLPRLLSAAAPPGNTAQRNRRQCLKVLRLWLERRILPEPIIRHHIRELNSYKSSASAGAFSRHSLRTERAFDDPIRQTEGMHVDEYGSNSSFQLPGFSMPQMLQDEGTDSDGGNFEAVTPERDPETHGVQEKAHAIDKHRHVLEGVDGELEMEDVAPSFDGGNFSLEKHRLVLEDVDGDVEMEDVAPSFDGGNVSQIDKKFPQSFAPPLPQDVPAFSPLPPLYHPSPPSRPPPPPPPPLTLHLMSAICTPPPPPPPTLHLMSSTSDQYHAAVISNVSTDSQTVNRKTLHSMAQPLAAPRSRRPISDAVQFRVPECREMQMQLSESTFSFDAYSVQPPDNSRSADMHNRSYVIRPPRHVPSDQFSFVNVERRRSSHREVPPSPSYSNRHHFVHSTKRENFYNNHERFKPPPYDYQERWNIRAPYSDVPARYGCHPSESTRSPGHGWRFPPPSMNYRDNMCFRPPFEDAIPVANRGPSFWPPR